MEYTRFPSPPCRAGQNEVLFSVFHNFWLVLGVFFHLGLACKSWGGRNRCDGTDSQSLKRQSLLFIVNQALPVFFAQKVDTEEKKSMRSVVTRNAAPHQTTNNTSTVTASTRTAHFNYLSSNSKKQAKSTQKARKQARFATVRWPASFACKFWDALHMSHISPQDIRIFPPTHKTCSWIISATYGEGKRRGHIQFSSPMLHNKQMLGDKGCEYLQIGSLLQK